MIRVALPSLELHSSRAYISGRCAELRVSAACYVRYGLIISETSMGQRLVEFTAACRLFQKFRHGGGKLKLTLRKKCTFLQQGTTAGV